MPSRTDGPGSRIPYAIRFTLSALGLAGVTLVLVLIVLPQRYVLSSGFRESGISFPTEGTPFQPADVVRRAAPVLPEIPASDAESLPGPGPAELLWSMVDPLLDAERYGEALDLFEDYLRDFPADRNVLREYAVILFWADRRDDAVQVLDGLLGGEDDTEIRLLLARTLRDMGRREDAGRHYEVLFQRTGDPEMALEWSRMWSWTEEYDPAVTILERALAARPDEAALQVELARLFYYTDRLQRAAALLAGLDDDALARLDGLALRDDVRTALAVPDEEEIPATLMEQALTARMEGEFERAARLFREALEERPGDAEIWQAYADLLQYEVGDFQGAREALLEVEALGDQSPALQYRLAQLEVWTGMGPAARARLEGLLARLQGEADPDEEDRVATADVLALLGDLHRWEDRRMEASVRYRSALALNPDHSRALEGMAALRALRDRTIGEVERPGLGVVAFGLGDTDDFSRVHLGGSWVGVQGVWVWRAESGNRWLEGIDLAGTPGDLQGVYGSLELARWWRWGTVRTGVSVGGEGVRSGTEDLFLGASVLLLPARGGSLELRYAHGPAYPLTGTLQSVAAGYVSDEVSLSGTWLPDRQWSVSGDLRASWLDPTELPGADGSTRLSAAASFSRTLNPTLALGLELRGLHYTDAAPFLGGRPLFWDPDGAVSLLPFARVQSAVAPGWTARGRMGAGPAFLWERRDEGMAIVPQFAAETGVEYMGDRFQGSLDLFYLQGQFDGYRSWGLRMRLATPLGWRGGGAP